MSTILNYEYLKISKTPFNRINRKNSLNATTNVMMDMYMGKQSSRAVYVYIYRELGERVNGHRRAIRVVHLGVMYGIEKQFHYEVLACIRFVFVNKNGSIQRIRIV